jgi:hypothetical protein
VDTREKIKSFNELREALAGEPWVVMVGGFEPLTAALAARIEHAKAPNSSLLIVLRSSRDEFFDVAARAVLLAALHAVDAVMVETSHEWRALVGRNSLLRVMEEAAADRCGREEFEQLVLSRQLHAVEGMR